MRRPEWQSTRMPRTCTRFPDERPPTQAEVQAIGDKLNELFLALRRRGCNPD